MRLAADAGPDGAASARRRRGLPQGRRPHRRRRVVEQRADAVVLEVGPGPRDAAAGARRAHRRAAPSPSPCTASAPRASPRATWRAGSRSPHWAEQHDLRTQAREACEHVARRRSRRTRPRTARSATCCIDGRWLSRARRYRARGFVEFEGHWMTPGERERRLAGRRPRPPRASEARSRDARPRGRGPRARGRGARAHRGGGGRTRARRPRRTSTAASRSATAATVGVRIGYGGGVDRLAHGVGRPGTPPRPTAATATATGTAAGRAADAASRRRAPPAAARASPKLQRARRERPQRAAALTFA